MFTLIENTPPGLALLAIVALVGIVIGCRAFVAVRLAGTIVRVARPEDLPTALATIATVVDSVFRLKR